MTEEFRRHLAEQTYDKLYQDIKPISLVGYSKSHQTWTSLQPLIDWKGLSVVDLGCFHGYFSFRIAEAGATKVVGLDRHAPALNTARKIADLEGSTATSFQQWDDSMEIPQADVTLCLNVLHHFKEPVECMKRFRSERAIFEVDGAFSAKIASVFDIVSQHKSHRKNRVILLAKRK